MINGSAWGHRQELKTRSLKSAKKKKMSSACWQLCLCVPTEMKSLLKASSPHSLRPPVSTPVGIQLGLRRIAARKPKESFAYGVCLQNNELLYYLREYGAQLSKMLHPCRFGEESDRLRGVNTKGKSSLLISFHLAPDMLLS